MFPLVVFVRHRLAEINGPDRSFFETILMREHPSEVTVFACVYSVCMEIRWQIILLTLSLLNFPNKTRFLTV